MTLNTKSLETLRAKISKRLKIGHTNVKFKKECVEEIKKMTDRGWKLSFVDRLIKEKKLRIIPKKKRLYKIYYNKELYKKDPSIHKRFKNLQSLNYLKKRKMITRKELWIKKIRTIRAYLKTKKGELDSKTYRTLRLRAKGNYYNSLNDLKKII